jgi:arsenical pump membrane protein
VTGFAVAFVSNVMNNLPVGLASGTAIQQNVRFMSIGHAVLLGVDLGPNLSVTGSLATILWLIAMRRENVEITAWQFLRAFSLYSRLPTETAPADSRSSLKWWFPSFDVRSARCGPGVRCSIR